MSTEAVIYQAARGKGIPAQLAYLMVAQAKHETGGFSSNFFKKYNNAFGYSYYPESKYQIGPGSIADNGQNIGVYASVADSAREVADWINRRKGKGFPADLNTIQTPDQYARILRDNGYYTAPLDVYSRGMSRFFLVDPAWAAGGGGLIFLMIVASGVYLYRRFAR